MFRHYPFQLSDEYEWVGIISVNYQEKYIQTSLQFSLILN